MSYAARADLYEEVTNRMIAEMEKGSAPWVQPWSNRGSTLSLPRNAATKRAYSGINILMLWGTVQERGFATQRWLTFRQALAAGGNVRKGEHGTTVFYADRFTPKDANNERDPDRSIPFLKRFTVFNIAQCENLPDEMTPREAPLPEREIIPHAEALILATGADIRIGGNRAYFAPGPDYIQMPPQSAFADQVNYYPVMYHELSHWAGAKSRLNREFGKRFGDHAYSVEELVAELSASFVCAELGLTPTLRHSDYLSHWLSVLKADKRAIFTAARQASAAADYLLAFRGETAAAADLAEAA